MSLKLKNFLIFLSLAVLILAWVLFLNIFGVERFIDSIGIHNGYLIVFLTALFGGITSVTGTFFFTALVTFSVGGLNTFFLAILGGIGLTISDSVIYYFVLRGVKLFPKYKDTKISKFAVWLSSKPKVFVNIIAILYFGLSPFPNEILVIVFALSRYKFINLLPALLIGNTLLSYIISHGTNLVAV